MQNILFENWNSGNFSSTDITVSLREVEEEAKMIVAKKRRKMNQKLPTIKATGVGPWGYYWPEFLYEKPANSNHPNEVIHNVRDRDAGHHIARYCKLTPSGTHCQPMRCTQGPDDLSGYLCNYQRNVRYTGYIGERLRGVA